MPDEISKDDLLEKIVADYTRRIRAGKPPAIASYKTKYPAVADELDDLLGSVAMIEGLKIETESGSENTSKLADLSDIQQLGDYLIIREIGRGGMGVVFEAVHQSLGRRVAVKVMRNRVEDEKYIARFRREARAAAKLHHTNIVSVFGVGEAEGYHYYVMEFIDGMPLNNMVRDFTLRMSGATLQNDNLETPIESHAAETMEWQSDPPHAGETQELSAERLQEEHADSDSISIDSGITQATVNLPAIADRYNWVARIGMQIADALEYAHSQGVLHRDIKPANLLIDRQEQVWITDFGLVKEIAEQGLTKTGDLIGTPQYMAPEAFKGIYDQQSEVYCLGLTLYELATLQPAFKQGSTAQVLHAIVNTTPPPPRKIDDKVPRDLDTIIAKSISRDVGQRYGSALELRNDLRAFLEDRPISARKPSVFEQAWRWGRRNPLPAALAALSALLLVAVAIVSIIGYASTNTAYAKLKEEAKQTETARKTAVANAKLATEKEQRAVKEFERAEANVSLAIEAFDKILTRIVSSDSDQAISVDGFRELSGIETTVSRQDAELLKQIVGFYERFASQNQEREELIGETARAFRRVGNIHHLVGETEDAIDAYERSLAIYEPALEKSPDSKQALLTVVDTRGELCAALRRVGDFPKSQRETDKTIRLIQSHSQNSDLDIQLALARTLSSTSSTVVSMVAVTNATGIDEFMERGGGPNRPKPARPVNRVRDQLSKFLTSVRRAIRITESLLENDPENEEYQSLLAKSLSSLAAVQLLFETKERDNAIDSINQSIEQFESLCKRFPENLDYKASLVSAILLIPSDQSTAKQTLSTKRLTDELVEKNPTPEYKQLKLMAHVRAAGVYVADKKIPTAMEELGEAVELLERLETNVSDPRAFGLLRLSIAQTYRAIDSSLGPDNRNLERQIRTQLGKIRPRSGFGFGFGRPPGGGNRPGRGGR